MFMKLMNGIHMSNLTCQEHFVKKFACSKLNKLRSICVCDFISRKISLKDVLIQPKKMLCNTTKRNFLLQVLGSNPSKNYSTPNVWKTNDAIFLLLGIFFKEIVNVFNTNMLIWIGILDRFFWERRGLTSVWYSLELC